MAVKATASVTISRIVDIKSVTRYYTAQSSSSSAPSKPTTNPPGSSWTTSEPEFTTTETRTLYFVDLVVYTNDTFSYSDVNKASSFEAAKIAYNKALGVETTITTLNNTVNSVKQTADANTSSISNLTQTVGQKADGSVVTALDTRLTSAEQDLSGFKTTVSQTYATQSSMNKTTEIIVGTQTASTNAFTGTSSYLTASDLKDGLQIKYWLPYAGASSSATLNLTYKDGTTSGAKNCYYNGTSRLTNHCPAGSIINFTYRENVSIAGSTTKYTGWWCDANYNSDTYDRHRYNATIVMGAAVATSDQVGAAKGCYGLFVATNNKYYRLNSTNGKSFDIKYPIVYYNANTAIAADGTTSNTYDEIAFNYNNYVKAQTYTAYKPIYLVGTLSGNTFTLDSTTYLTQTEPATKDGKVYMQLGVMYNTTTGYLLQEHPMYIYTDNGFQDINARVSTAESSIKQNADNIELKVSKNGVISAINQSAEAVSISANKINLTGAITISYLAEDTNEMISGISNYADTNIKDLQSQISDVSGTLSGDISTIQTDINALTEQADSFITQDTLNTEIDSVKTDINSTNASIQNVRDSVIALSDNVNKYLEFNSTNGLSIGDTSSPIKTYYTNDGSDIRYNGNKVAKFGSEGIETKEITIGDLTDNQLEWRIFSPLNHHLTFTRKK